VATVAEKGELIERMRRVRELILRYLNPDGVGEYLTRTYISRRNQEIIESRSRSTFPAGG